MADFTVPITQIFIKEHPDADRLQLGHIGAPDGFQVVVGKGLYQSGDYVAYIGENSVIPEEILKEYGYWNVEKNIGMLGGKKGTRVRAVKLRNQFSLGIVLPLMINTVNGSTAMRLRFGCEEYQPRIEHCWFTLGEDVAHILGVTKYEPPIPTCMAGEVWNASGLTLSYDIENFRKYPDVLVEGEDVFYLEKLHGCADYHTLIDTVEFGVLPIGHIVQQQLCVHVASYDTITNEISYNLVESHRELPNNDDWYELETVDGEVVKLTGNHPVWLPDINCYRRVDELVGTEKVLVM